ncbi:MAG: lysine--tRNA ligase [Deltaproteobacteria bacterium]|nr:lysine--tRNA ligase [Deltaproteobacteria bacterium]
MTKVAWPQQEASKILKNFKGQEEILFETGYGPSGLPHIGTFAEVARTLFVLEALRELKPDIKTRLIVFSDDKDGLRNLPENIPNHDLIRPYLGASLTSIPDPFEEAESFAGYMNRKLMGFLDSFGFDYELRSSTQCYGDGLFDEGLKRVMDHYDEIHDIFTRGIAENKRASWSPFFPVCESCGKIYTTQVTDLDRKNYRLDYRCDQDGELYKACGHQGSVPVTGGKVKVGWKVDWALRWHVFGIHYEMYGKDLMESAEISGRICRVLGSPPPVTYKYELFLDENGAKISKKIGNGISMEQWMKYAPLGVLLNFLLANPNKAKKMGLPILSRLIDEYLQCLRTQDAGEENSVLWYLAKIQKQKEAQHLKIGDEIGYGLLYNVAESLSIHDAELLYDYALKYDSDVIHNRAFYFDLCERVIAFFEDFHEERPIDPDEIDGSFFEGLEDLKAKLISVDERDLKGEETQQLLFLIAREREYNQRSWFHFLYQVLLGKEQGPKMGPFFAILGKTKTLELIDQAIASQQPTLS